MLCMICHGKGRSKYKYEIGSMKYRVVNIILLSSSTTAAW